MNNDNEEIVKEWKKLIVAQDLEYWKCQQKNFSKDAEKIFTKVQNGEKLTELDIFTLCNDNQQQIDEYAKFYHIREDIKNNRLSKSDLHYLIDVLCDGDKQSSDQMKIGFSFLINDTQEQKENS